MVKMAGLVLKASLAVSVSSTIKALLGSVATGVSAGGVSVMLLSATSSSGLSSAISDKRFVQL